MLIPATVESLVQQGFKICESLRRHVLGPRRPDPFVHRAIVRGLQAVPWYRLTVEAEHPDACTLPDADPAARERHSTG
jgi:hypothetical protein